MWPTIPNGWTPTDFKFWCIWYMVVYHRSESERGKTTITNNLKFEITKLPQSGKVVHFIYFNKFF